MSIVLSGLRVRLKYSVGLDAEEDAAAAKVGAWNRLELDAAAKLRSSSWSASSSKSESKVRRTGAFPFLSLFELEPSENCASIASTLSCD